MAKKSAPTKKAPVKKKAAKKAAPPAKTHPSMPAAQAWERGESIPCARDTSH